MVEEREKLIGARLRDFREALQIPRSRFAVSIGFGSERIASYEAGRAPLPYCVFRAVSKRFHISASWLATGEGSPKDAPLNDAHIVSKLSPTAKFSAVYADLLAQGFDQRRQEAEHMADEFIERLDRFMEMLKDPIARKMSPKILDRFVGTLKKVNRKLQRDLRFRQSVKISAKRPSKPARL